MAFENKARAQLAPFDPVQANELIGLSFEAHETYMAARLKKDPPPILRFDANVTAARAVIAAAADEAFLKPWSLLSGGKTIFTLPRAAVLRSFVLSHSIHHRAHLCVYLRVNNVPVPSIYGPSADETGM